MMAKLMHLSPSMPRFPLTERTSRREPRHFCRAAGALAGVAVALASCATTHHELGPATDPATEHQIDQLVAQHDTFVETKKPVGSLDPRLGSYRVFGSKPGVLMLAGGDRDTPVPVPLVEVVTIRKFDRPRGAYECAVRGGAAGFFGGLLVGTVLGLIPQPADRAPERNPASLGLEYGLVTGLAGAAIGATFGGLIGHEDRYWPVAP
jgi:hypothetical protein